MRLDLRTEFADIYAHLADRLRHFDRAGADVLGDGGAVKLIEIGFECTQAGWLVVVFDTRPDADSDGEWASLVDGNQLARPDWQTAGELLIDEPAIVVDREGTELELSSSLELAEILGELIKEVLLQAGADGLFSTLPNAPRCKLWVEHYSGYYVWSALEERSRGDSATT